MSYNGYLIKINNATIPNRLIDRSSWSITPQARKVIESFYDIDGRYHEYLADHQRATVQFTIREHSEAEHVDIVTYLKSRYNVKVQYYDDLNEVYASGSFRINDFVFKHKKTFDGTVWYDATPITLTEY